MFYQVHQLTVKEGTSSEVVERFTKRGKIEDMPGFLAKDVLVKKVRRGDEEVMILIKWESEEAWKNWEKSPEHIAVHKAKLKEGNPKPDYLLESQHGLYYKQN